MMDYRENAGYVITDSCHVGESEFVLGVHLTAPQQFVTWKCKDRTDYYWGHYFSSLFDAQKDLVARAHEEVQYLEQRGIDPNKMELEPADSPGEKSRPATPFAPALIPSAPQAMAGLWSAGSLRTRCFARRPRPAALWSAATFALRRTAPRRWLCGS